MDSLLETVALALGKPFPTDSKLVWKYIWELAALRFPVLMEIATATEELAKRRLQCLVPKDPATTELDRSTLMQAGAAGQEATLSRLSSSSL